MKPTAPRLVVPKPVEPEEPPRTESARNAERAMNSLAGKDEFSEGSSRRRKRKPLLDLKPPRREVPALREGEKPLEVVESAFLRRLGKILK